MPVTAGPLRILCLLPLLGGARAADWPCYRGSTHDGKVPALPADPPVQGWPVAWKAQVGAGYGGVTIANGRFYTIGAKNDQNELVCLDGRDGHPLWKYPWKVAAVKFYPGPKSSPAVAGGRVFALSEDGQLQAVDEQKGTLLWSRRLAEDCGATPQLPENFPGYSTSPIVVDAGVLVQAAVAGASVALLDPATGKTRWQAGNDPGFYASPLPFTWQQQPVVGVMGDAGLTVYALADGKRLWDTPKPTINPLHATEPVLTGDTGLFLSSGSHTGWLQLRLNTAKPEKAWDNAQGPASQDAVPMYDEGLIFGHFGQQFINPLTCIQASDGKLCWVEKTVCGNSILAGRQLLTLTGDGRLVVSAADRAAFKKVGEQRLMRSTRADSCWSSPVVADRWLAARNLPGELVVLLVGPPDQKGSSPPVTGTRPPADVNGKASVLLPAPPAGVTPAWTLDVPYARKPEDYLNGPVRQRLRQLKDASGKTVLELLSPSQPETAFLALPKGEMPAAGWGLLVFISPTEQGGILEPHLADLERHRLVLVAPHRIGNDQPVPRRMRVALDALASVKAHVLINPQRVYVGGISGGGATACLTAANWPEAWKGVLSFVRGFSLEEVKAGPKSVYPSEIPHFTPADRKALAKADLRWAFVTGDQDFNYQSMLAMIPAWKQAQMPYRLFDVPGLGHELGQPALFSRIFDAVMTYLAGQETKEFPPRGK